nr:immunoglobulin heavy chain junction region [Mus musculus]
CAIGYGEYYAMDYW